MLANDNQGNLYTLSEFVTSADTEIICLDPWMIGYSKPRAQRAAKQSLERVGLECWYPIRKRASMRPQRTLPSKTRHKRRFELVEKIDSVLGGYIFIRRLRRDYDLGMVHELPGVGGLCRFGGAIAMLADWEVEMIRVAEADGKFNVYAANVPGTYRLAVDPRSLKDWTGRTRLLGRLDESNESVQFVEELGRVLRFIRSTEQIAGP